MEKKPSLLHRRPSFIELLSALWGAEEELAQRRFQKYKKRQRDILLTLYYLSKQGQIGTTKRIAERLGLNVNGVSQSLGALDCVECLGGKGGETRWRLKEKS